MFSFSPAVFFFSLLCVTGVVWTIHRVMRHAHKQKLRELAGQWGMQYAQADLFNLAPRVAGEFPIPGVADLNNGAASWRSDVRVFNGGSSPQTATLTFYPLGGGASSTKSLTVSPGQVAALDDILHSLFGKVAMRHELSQTRHKALAPILVVLLGPPGKVVSEQIDEEGVAGGHCEFETAAL